MNNILCYKHKDVNPKLFKIKGLDNHKWQTKILNRDKWDNSDIIFLLRDSSVNIIKSNNPYEDKEIAYPIFINKYRKLLIENKIDI